MYKDDRFIAWRHKKAIWCSRYNCIASLLLDGKQIKYREIKFLLH